MVRRSMDRAQDGRSGRAPTHTRWPCLAARPPGRYTVSEAPPMFEFNPYAGAAGARPESLQ